MRSAQLGLAVLLVAIGASLRVGHAFQATNGWPPSVQQVSEASPVLSPEAALKTFYMPPGYHLELVASEPMIREPIIIEWDFSGRLWVVQMEAFIPDFGEKHDRDPVCSIVVLEDTNHDGKMDKRTVFADRLILPRAIKILDHGSVLVAESPNLWLMKDTNGDLKMDTKELVTDTYGEREASPEHNANSLLWAMDNWIYTSEHTGYLRLKNGKFEMARTLPRGQWGATQDDAGRIYRNTNGSAGSVDLIQPKYFIRNPSLPRTRGMYESLAEAGDDLNVTWPVRSNYGVNRGYQSGQLRPDGTLARFTAATAPTIYRGDRLPAELYGNLFVAEPAGNLVSRVILSDDGTTIHGKRAYEKGEFLVSTDERFRPVWLSSAPDGTLYIADLYRGVIQDRDLITTYLHDWIVKHDLEKGVGYGRIYRVVHDTTRRGPAPALATATPAALVAALSHPNGWWRDSAQQLLVQRADRSSIPGLKTLAATAPLARTRVQALWTLDGFDAIDAETVTRALDDTSRDVRVAAVRLSERWIGTPNHPLQAALLKHLDDPDWSVRQQLAATLGEMKPAAEKESAIASLLEHHASDPVVLDAALSGLRGSEAAVLEKLLQAGTRQTPPLDLAIAMVAATITRSRQEAPIERVFALVAEDARAEWQRSALLRGTEMATVGVTAGRGGRGGGGGAAGGGAGRGAGAADADAAAGGRGADAGDRAFDVAPGANNSMVFFGADPAPPLITVNMAHEPSLVAFAARDRSDLGARATRVLTKVDWPGKPGVARAVVAPMTTVEQQRFDSGKVLYQALCVGCHQADGRGLPSLAPPLAGSEVAQGAPGITARILMHGKEGAIGLMPPIGGALNDDQLAAILTYIRREWGNTASPVDATTPRDVRIMTAGRTRPWTEDELIRAAAPPRP